MRPWVLFREDLLEFSHFQAFLKRRYGRTYGHTDIWTYGRTDGRTDTPSYRDARTHLKIRCQLKNYMHIHTRTHAHADRHAHTHKPWLIMILTANTKNFRWTNWPTHPLNSGNKKFRTRKFWSSLSLILALINLKIVVHFIALWKFFKISDSSGP